MIQSLLKILNNGDLSAARSILAALTVSFHNTTYLKYAHLQTYRILETIRPAPWDTTLRSSVPLTEDEIKQVIQCIGLVKQHGVKWRFYLRRVA